MFRIPEGHNISGGHSDPGTSECGGSWAKEKLNITYPKKCFYLIFLTAGAQGTSSPPLKCQKRCWRHIWPLGSTWSNSTKHECKAPTPTAVDSSINRNRHCEAQRSHAVKLFLKTTLRRLFIWVTAFWQCPLESQTSWQAGGKQYNRQTALCNQPRPTDGFQMKMSSTTQVCEENTIALTGTSSGAKKK